ncbi:helix-turn-helix transcriptional regulator [Streptomyces sp. NPDC002754]
MINYYRFCCRIRIADEYADEVPGGEFLAVEEGRARDRQEQFADGRISGDSDWFRETPALVAHVRALKAGDTRDIRHRLVSTSDAMRYTGVDSQTLYRWRREGRLSWHRLGPGRSAGWDVVELPRAGSGPPPRSA